MTHHAHEGGHEHRRHPDHEHAHGPGCGHETVRHEGHTDYAHGGHLHHPHDDHVEEHALGEDAATPAACTPEHDCAAHGSSHAHGERCEHAAVPHGDHTDYVVDGHLHHPHGNHCDEHGSVRAA